MGKNTYKIVSKFKCCGVTMVTVIMDEQTACVMPEIEFNKMIEAERKYYKRYNLNVA